TRLQRSGSSRPRKFTSACGVTFTRQSLPTPKPRTTGASLRNRRTTDAEATCNGRQDMLTVKEAAAKIGVSGSLVYAWCQAGVLNHRRFGRPGKRGCIRIDEIEFDAFMAECQTTGRQTLAPIILRHIKVK